MTLLHQLALRLILVQIVVMSNGYVKRADNACDFGTTTITNFQSATAITSCATLTGDVVIATSTTGDLNLDGPLEIKGSLIAKDVKKMVSMSSDTLQTIAGFLTLDNVQILTTFNFTQLQSVGTVDVTGLPNLQGFSFLQTLKQVQSINIQNSEIGEVVGFALQSVGTVNIVNNPYLDTINLQPDTVTTSLLIEGNGQYLDLSMPNLEAVGNIALRNVSRLNIPQLTRVSEKMTIDSNYISSLDGMPSLQSIDGGLEINDNAAMENMSLTLLQSIDGGLQIINNSALTTIDNLYVLDKINGDVQIIGSLSSITFPALNTLHGSLSITSTKAMPCTSFNNLYRNDVIKQSYYCRTANDTGVSDRSLPAGVSSSNSSSATTSAGAHAGGTSSALRIGVGVGVGVGGALAIAGALWFIFRRRHATKHSPTSLATEVDGVEVDRAAMLADGEKHELDQPTVELPSGWQAQELQAAHGESELSPGDSAKMPAASVSRHELP